MALGNRHHEPQVRRDHLSFRRRIAPLDPLGEDGFLRGGEQGCLADIFHEQLGRVDRAVDSRGRLNFVEGIRIRLIGVHLALLAEDPRGAGEAGMKGHGAFARVLSRPVVAHNEQVPAPRGAWNRGHSATPTAAMGRARSARRVGTASARTASTVDPPRITKSGLPGTNGVQPSVTAWLKGTRAVAAISSPTPRPIATINAASQRAIERT